MNEHGFINAVHRPLRKNAAIDIWKINANFANGVPDAWYAGGKNTVWVEYKYLKAWPKRSTTVIDLTNDKQYLSVPQQKWLERKHTFGVNIAVVLGVGNDAVILRGLEWKRPYTTGELKSLAIARGAVPHWIAEECTGDVECAS